MTSCTRSRPRLGWLLLILASAVSAQQPTAPAAVAETMVAEGRVVDMRGEGVPAAKVWLAPHLEPDQVLLRTVTDGDGYFRIGKVPKRDDLWTRATADGYCVAVGMRDGGITTVELQQTATVTGVLRNRAGKPMAGTTVVARVNGRTHYWLRCSAQTDAEGHFVLRDVPLAPMQISAWIPGEGVASIAHHVAADGDVVLQPGNDATTAITIAVEGLPDAALATLRVGVALQRDVRYEDLPPPLDTRDMPERTRRLEGVPDAEYRITAQAPGWQFTPGPVTLQTGRGPHTVTFTASPVDTQLRSCPIEVRDAEGKPVAGVALTMRAARGGSESRATTDADGKATLHAGLAVGSKAILAAADDRWVTDQTKAEDLTALRGLRDDGRYEFVFDPGQTQQVRLIAACSVRGRLLRHDGRPAPFTWVELQEHRTNGWPAWGREGFTTTDRDGGFVLSGLHCTDAEVRVSTESPLGAWTSEPFDLSRPGTVIRLRDVRLAEPAIIAGVLRSETGRPVAGVRVQLRDWDMDLRRQRSGNVNETLTDRDGRYRFVGVPPGGAWLRLLAEPDARLGAGISVGQFVVEAGRVHMHDLELPAK